MYTAEHPPKHVCTDLCFFRRRVYFEVWDRDSVWDDDLLGKPSVIPTVGLNVKKLKLNHGSLTVKLSVECAPSLQGSLCEQYLASPNNEGPMGYSKKDHWGSGRPGQEGAHGNLL